LERGNAVGISEKIGHLVKASHVDPNTVRASTCGRYGISHRLGDIAKISSVISRVYDRWLKSHTRTSEVGTERGNQLCISNIRAIHGDDSPLSLDLDKIRARLRLNQTCWAHSIQRVARDGERLGGARFTHHKRTGRVCEGQNGLSFTA
jgi:hypothetical protein